MIYPFYLLPANAKIIAPLVLADPDDTGKALHALNLMGRQVRPNQMIDKFRTSDGYFRTYPGERGVSLSTNCNALRAMLHSPNVENYTAEIVSSANFLCGLWWRGEFGDKWVSKVKLLGGRYFD